ncbi:MAG: ribosome maturation factor RimM [Methylococcales bacterium]|nr:ribosome maturation factor RimM [Methylococcales bacterium]
MSEETLLHVGKISGVFGIKGWVKVFSFTGYREDILQYSPWQLKKNGVTKHVEIVTGQLQNQLVVAQLKGIDDRNAAEALIGWEIFIEKSQLPAVKEHEYYWSDLIGLQVENTEGVVLGVIDNLLETGANDVIVVQGEERQHAIPFLQPQIVLEIDLAARKMRVDWDADF